MIEAVTFDFGNTLVPVAGPDLRRVVLATAGSMARQLGPFQVDDVVRAWDEERERQFREDVPQFREVDIGQRIVRVLARLRGMAAPADDVPWDQAAAGRLSSPAEVEWVIGEYSGAFVAALPPRPEVGRLLGRLSTAYRLAILSNWPLAATIDRYAAAAGWTRYLRAIVVSQRVGAIKPDPRIFAAARAALGDPPADRILHVGDDWAADIVGARQAGWRTAYLLGRPGDSPLPRSDREMGIVADVEIAGLNELEAALSGL